MEGAARPTPLSSATCFFSEIKARSYFKPSWQLCRRRLAEIWRGKNARKCPEICVIEQVVSLRVQLEPVLLIARHTNLRR
jgi:hypothetical protein